MKKLIILTLCFILVTSLSACTSSVNTDSGSSSAGGSGSSVATVSGSSSAGGSGSGVATVVKTDEKGTFNSETVLNSLETQSYTWENGSWSYLALIIKNNSDFDCKLEANVIFKDAAGQTIGADESYEYAFEKHTETCMVFQNESAFSTFEYSYDVSKLDYYTCYTSSMTCESSAMQKKAILTFTNTSEKEVGTLSCDVLFLQGDRVVDCSICYESNIAAGKQFAKEVNFYNSKADYDNLKVYYQAYTYE